MRAALLIVLLIGALVGLSSLDSFQHPMTPVASVAAKPLDRWPDRVTADGVVEGARPEAALRPEVVGTVAAIFVSEGQEVVKGSLLAELRNALQKQQIALASAEETIARARLDRLRNGEPPEKRLALAAAEQSRRILYERAKSDWERSHKLQGRGYASQEEHDQHRLDMIRAKADWDQATAEHALIEAPARAEEMTEAEGHVAVADTRTQLAQVELAKTRLLAPFSGRVLRVYAVPGELAGPTTDQPILLLADLSRHRVRAFVEELDALRVQVGQPAMITAAGLPGRQFSGKVSVVSPRMGRRTLPSDEPSEYKDLDFREVMIDLDAGDELPLNLRVQVRISVNSAKREGR